MPYRRKARRPRLRRPPRLRRRKIRRRFLPRKMARATRTLIRQPSGVGDSLFVKLKYTNPYTYSITAGAGLGQVMRGNSTFDPDFTGVGGQPYFFDQWSTFYQAYTVMGSKIKVDAYSNNGSAAYEIIVVPSTSSTSFGATGQELVIEQPYAKHRTMQYTTANTVLYSYMSTNKIIGIRKSQVMDDPNLSAAVTANPASQWFWHVWANTVDNSSTVTLSVRITVTYYVRFFNRARPSIS